MSGLLHEFALQFAGQRVAPTGRVTLSGPYSTQDRWHARRSLPTSRLHGTNPAMAGPTVFTPSRRGSGENKNAYRNHSTLDDCRSAHLRRYSLGATPISRLNTRLKELSDPYPMADATSEKDILFERIIAPALYIRQRVRYSSGVRPKTVLNFKAKADLDMLASRARDAMDQLLSRRECIACMALLRCLSDMAANHPVGGASEPLA